MRIAIIGASGMLGRHTVQAAVAAGHGVVAIGRSAKSLGPLTQAGIETRLGDMSDGRSLAQALQGVEAVINCAGYYPTLPRPWQSEGELATRDMREFYEVCATLPLSKIVYLGAAIALPRDPSGRPGTEELDYAGRPDNLNPYLQVKWALDKQAPAYAEQGLPVVIGIPTMSLASSISAERLVVSFWKWRIARCPALSRGVVTSSMRVTPDGGLSGCARMAWPANDT